MIYILGLIYCESQTPSDIFRDQLIDKPELKDRLAFYAMWLDAVGQTNDFEENYSQNYLKKRNISNDQKLEKSNSD